MSASMTSTRVKAWMSAAGAATALLWTAGATQADAVQPSESEMTHAVTQYLSEHGDLCVGKFTWPRVVTRQDQQDHTNDAIQLPVLEHLGLVKSTEIPVPTAAGAVQSSGAPPAADATAETARRYALTAKGRRYYLHKKRITLGAHDLPAEHDDDLCVARIRLEKVVKWLPPEQMNGHLQTLVHYTYQLKAVDWMADPEARRVFPVVDKIIRGEHNLLMSVTVRLQDGKWEPVLPG